VGNAQIIDSINIRCEMMPQGDRQGMLSSGLIDLAVLSLNPRKKIFLSLGRFV
jgi:hypothetical protein